MIQIQLTYADFENLKDCLATAKRVYTDEFNECNEIIEKNPESELKPIAQSWGERKNTVEALLNKLRKY